MKPAFSLTIAAAHPRLGTETGVRENGLLHFRNAQPGTALFGGYFTFGAGRYNVQLNFSPAVPVIGSGTVDVCTDMGRKVIGATSFDGRELSPYAPQMTHSFTLDAESHNLEVRLLTSTDFTGCLESIEISELRWTSFLERPPTARTRMLPDAKHRLSILYYSCHEILEYDELRMFTDLGHRVFSIGHFGDPLAAENLRPALKQFFYEDDWQRFSAAGRLTADFLERFDLAVVMHTSAWVHELLALKPDLPVLYRSIGQSTVATESSLAQVAGRMKIVRYSNHERSLPGFQDADAVIYFGKYLMDYYLPWVGGGGVLTFHHHYRHRNSVSVPNVDDYAKIAAEFPCNLFGLGNGDLPFSRGEATSKEQLQLYRHASIYLYVYSVPPSYTLSFMEAMATGVPILAPTADFILATVSPEMQEQTSFCAERYEIEKLLGHDPALLYSSIDDAREKLRWLLANPDYCREVSAKLRSSFIEFFNAEKICSQWNELFLSVV